MLEFPAPSFNTSSPSHRARPTVDAKEKPCILLTGQDPGTGIQPRPRTALTKDAEIPDPAGGGAQPAMPDSRPRKPSLKERFWSVSAANHEVDKDREAKRQQQAAASSSSSSAPYHPTHAASDFIRTTSPRPPGQQGSEAAAAKPDAQDTKSGDYAAFLARSEARDIASQMYGESSTAEKAAASKSRPRNTLARRIAEYIKPTREGEQR